LRRFDTSLAVDEDQERGLIQERIARRVEEFDAPGAQRLSQGRRHVVCHEQRIATVGPQLMDDRPKRCRPQTSLDLDAVPKFAPAEAQAENGVRPAVTAPLLVEHLEAQAERLHRLDGGG
jgi:hypothetical protein